MNKISLIMLLLFSLTATAADVTLNWTKPDPKWSVAVPPDWDIDGYNVFATPIGEGAPITDFVSGYDTESYVFDLSPGDWDVCISSYTSNPSNVAYRDSILVCAPTVTVLAPEGPNPPSDLSISVQY